MEAVVKQHPQLRGLFDFQELNAIQKACLPLIMARSDNLIVSAPTSSGKTVLFELAIAKHLPIPSSSTTPVPTPLCLYLAPIKSLCHEKYTQWERRFRGRLRVAQVTGDSLEGGDQQYASAHITVGTPQKVDFLSRQNLQYLKQIRLLLVDEVHMLNFEERGATLEAIVSRIMSLNRAVRIVAVSATIPNINEVAEWLKVPKPCVCVFGEEYRPVKIKRVVLGFKSTGNPFTFERALNFKLLQAVRLYSEGRGSLIFCATQRGTESACQQIVAMMRDREFIENDKQLTALVQAARQVSNSTLQLLLPQGLAFHNASLSPQDRNVVERLFLDLKVRVLCTTSTLAMGINLPARLVIVKSTQSYKGSMKGYQEYSRIEIDQMLGRAGRPPFDTEGTVVIMTEKQHYNRYSSSLQLEDLESQLFSQMLEHLNAEVSLGSICSLDHVYDYIRNSFCYIRMKKSPANYGISGSVDLYAEESCRKAVESLAHLAIITFNQESGRLFPRPLSHSISRSAVEVASIALITKTAFQIRSQREYLLALCGCPQIGRYNSKVEERKSLKEMNEKNRFAIREAVSTCERKSFVLAQAELSHRHIDFWELRRQAADILTLLRRLNSCIKVLGSELKAFWLYYWASRYQKYLSARLWEAAGEHVLLQFSGMEDKHKFLTLRGIRTLQDFRKSLPEIAGWLQKGPQFETVIREELQCYEDGVRVAVSEERKDATTVRVSLQGKLTGKMKGVNVCVGCPKNSLYFQRHLHEQFREVTITFPRNRETYHIAVLKDGIIGFDQFYALTGTTLTAEAVEKPQEKQRQRKSVDLGKAERDMTAMKGQSEAHENRKHFDESITSNIQKKMKERQKLNRRPSPTPENTTTLERTPTSQGDKQLKLPLGYRIRQPVEPDLSSDEEMLSKRLKVGDKWSCKPLKEYRWRPGFAEISSSSEEEPKRKPLRLVDSKPKLLPSRPPSKDKKPSLPQRPTEAIRPKALSLTVQQPPSKPKESSSEDVFSYFYNLF